jgi:hypothetical protein
VHFSVLHRQQQNAFLKSHQVPYNTIRPLSLSACHWFKVTNESSVCALMFALRTHAGKVKSSVLFKRAPARFCVCVCTYVCGALCIYGSVRIMHCWAGMRRSAHTNTLTHTRARCATHTQSVTKWAPRKARGGGGRRRSIGCGGRGLAKIPPRHRRFDPLEACNPRHTHTHRLNTQKRKYHSMRQRMIGAPPRSCCCENFIHKSFVGKCLFAYSNYDLFCPKCARTSLLPAAWEIKMFASGDEVIFGMCRARSQEKTERKREVASVGVIGDQREGNTPGVSASRYWIGGARGFPAFECSSKFAYYAVGSAIRRTYKQQTTCKMLWAAQNITFHHCIWPGGCDVFIQWHVSSGEILRAWFLLTCPAWSDKKVCLLFQ